MARRLLLDLAPLRTSPAYARLWAGTSIASIGGQLTIVAVGLHIYELTESTLSVSLVGIIALVPTILAGLYGGTLADAFDRRLVALAAAVISWLSTGTIAVLAWTNAETVGSLYVLTALTAAASTVLGTAQSATVPRLLPAELLPAASALSGISSGIAITLGPALAGVLVAAVGFGWTYTVDVVLFLAAFLGIVTLPRIRPGHEGTRPGFRSIADGLAFLGTAPNLRMNFLVDIVAMVFGQPRVLFPAAGAILLGGGPVTVGVLSAAFAVGALAASLFSGRLGQVRAHGIAIGVAIRYYGIFIAGFGGVLAVLAVAFPRPDGPSWVAIGIASVLLAGAGASDQVSAVFRSTMLQAAAPDHFRGRLQGIFLVVVTGGPRVGDLYVGIVATIGMLWLPPALGGLIIVALVGLMIRRSRTFRSYDALNPTP